MSWKSMMPIRHLLLAGVAVLALRSLTSPAAPAENAERPSLSPNYRFAETGGDDLFASVCQGCHMPDGNGAVGAGSYPALTHDSNLEAKGYPVYVIVRGQRAMPPVGALMSDGQVAAVVNYVRTHFGNHFEDSVSADDVKAVRP